MTVEELMEKLKEMPLTALVFFSGDFQTCRITQVKDWGTLVKLGSGDVL